MIVGGVALGCCCGSPEAPCSTLDNGSSPATIAVQASVGVEVEWKVALVGGGYNWWKTTCSIDMSGNVAKLPSWSGSNKRLYTGSLDASWSISQEVFEGDITGDSEANTVPAGQGGANFNLYCKTTTGTPWNISNPAIDYCTLAPIAELPLLHSVITLAPGSTNAPFMPSSPWQGVPCGISTGPNAGVGFCNEIIGSLPFLQWFVGSTGQKNTPQPARTYWVKQNAPIAGNYELVNGGQERILSPDIVNPLTGRPNPTIAGDACDITLPPGDGGVLGTCVFSQAMITARSLTITT